MIDLNKVIVDLQTGELSEEELFEMYDAGYLNNDEMDAIYSTIDYIEEGVLADRVSDMKAGARNINNAVQAGFRYGASNVATGTANALGNAAILGSKLGKKTLQGSEKVGNWITNKYQGAKHLVKNLGNSIQHFRGKLDDAGLAKANAQNLQDRINANNAYRQDNAFKRTQNLHDRNINNIQTGLNSINAKQDRYNQKIQNNYEARKNQIASDRRNEYIRSAQNDRDRLQAKLDAQNAELQRRQQAVQ